jgi:hypothetical protein
MPHDQRLVCDHCHAYLRLTSAASARVADLRDDAELGPWLLEHEDCRPSVRIAAADDERLEGYREHYEEA